MIFGTPGVMVKPTSEMRPISRGLSLTNTKSGVQIKLNNSYQQTVSAEIMSMNGKMVRHLSGNEASFWNCKDAFGNTVKNGTYLIRVCVAGKTYQDKVLISR